ncbi:MAG: hypothetical protein K0S57_1569 [Ramlibacter sp.]|jgi:hypothetical protein|nr:hypothetical protein [Ramlibacter sp.]
MDSAKHREFDAPIAACIAGAVAGAAYLAAQGGTAALFHGGMAEPLQRIAAILMGPNTAPPPTEFTATVAGMGLMIHFALAAVFGRIVGAVAGTRTVGASALVGALVGAGIYAANFLVIAPVAFPWFEQSPSMTTLLNHLLFGAVAGGVFASLRNARTPSFVSTSARR